MHLTRYEDPIQFWAETSPFLREREAEHNLMLGLMARLADKAAQYDSANYMAAVEKNGNIIGVALRTPPYNLILSHMEESEALNLITDDVYDRYKELPGVLGSTPFSRQFAMKWSTLTEQRFRLRMSQGIYRLEQVIPVKGVPGQMRRSTENDRDLIRDWLEAFMTEAITPTEGVTSEKVSQSLNSFFVDDTRVIYLWEQGGESVSMAAHTNPTPNGIRINAVFTPPQHRRNGYASALTASLSQMMLEVGREFCFLYTDLKNPTSNHIYQEIGYKLVCESEDWRFE